jgi:hypothetical protein
MVTGDLLSLARAEDGEALREAADGCGPAAATAILAVTDF